MNTTIIYGIIASVIIIIIIIVAVVIINNNKQSSAHTKNIADKLRNQVNTSSKSSTVSDTIKPSLGYKLYKNKKSNGPNFKLKTFNLLGKKQLSNVPNLIQYQNDLFIGTLDDCKKLCNNWSTCKGINYKLEQTPDKNIVNSQGFYCDIPKQTQECSINEQKCTECSGIYKPKTLCVISKKNKSGLQSNGQIIDSSEWNFYDKL